MGAFDIFEIVATGKGAHAAMPSQGKDPMLFAAHAIQALQTIVARNLHPQDAGVVSVTQVHGGDTWNVIPEEVVLRGTVRSFKPEVQALIEARMRTLVAGIAAMFEMRATLRYERRYPATVNSPAETGHALAAAAAVVGTGGVIADPTPEMGQRGFRLPAAGETRLLRLAGGRAGRRVAGAAQPALRLQRRRAGHRRELSGDARRAAAGPRRLTRGGLCSRTFRHEPVRDRRCSRPRGGARSGGVDQRPRVPRDHQFLVGGNHPRTGAAARHREPRTLGRVGGGVGLDAEPGRERSTRARTGAACSPMPPVNTSASMPPSAAASEPSSRWIR